MRKKILLLGLLLSIAILGWRVYSTAQKKAEQSAQKNVVVIPRVEVILPVLRTANETVESWGTAEAESKVSVQSTVGGKLLQWKRSEGETVKQGDIIAIVDRNLEPQEFNHAEILAPASGILTHRLVDEGATITNQTLLATIEDLSTILVPVQVAQIDIGKIRQGGNVELRCNSFPDVTFPGTVTRIDNVSDPVSHATRVEIALRDQRIKPGMHLRATFLLTRLEALSIPSSAILEQDSLQVTAVVRNGRIRRTPVIAGIRVGDWRMIQSGLSASDSVVTTGVDQFYEGDSVVVARSISQ